MIDKDRHGVRHLLDGFYLRWCDVKNWREKPPRAGTPTCLWCLAAWIKETPA
jgi:hypothetical protein